MIDMHPFDPDPDSKHHWVCGCGDCACHGHDGGHAGVDISCPTGYNDPYPPYRNGWKCSCMEASTPTGEGGTGCEHEAKELTKGKPMCPTCGHREEIHSEYRCHFAAGGHVPESKRCHCQRYVPAADQILKEIGFI